MLVQPHRLFICADMGQLKIFYLTKKSYCNSHFFQLENLQRKLLARYFSLSLWHAYQSQTTNGHLFSACTTKIPFRFRSVLGFEKKAAFLSFLIHRREEHWLVCFSFFHTL